MNMKVKNKFNYYKVCLIIVFSLLIITMIGMGIITANALNQVDTVYGYKSINMKGSTSQTSFNGKMDANTYLFSTDNLAFSGIAKSSWLGTNPFNADSVTHQDIITVSGIGGVSFSNSGVGASITDRTATYTYQVSNDWSITSHYHYVARIIDKQLPQLFNLVALSTVWEHNNMNNLCKFNLS